MNELDNIGILVINSLKTISYPYLFMKYSQKSLISKVEREVRKNSLILPGDNIVVAVSGGPDSICLLHVLNNLKDKLKFDLFACHYNHKLREEASDRDEEFVKKICWKQGIECVFGSAAFLGKLKSEDQARKARYDFFQKILNQSRGAKVALGHTMNDLAETVLFRLIRGTGLRGLKAIPLRREEFIRPLLSINRSEILAYLSSENISFRNDKTNMDTNFTRNFLRLKILPKLAQINPNVIKTLANAAGLIEEDYAFLTNLTMQALQEILLKVNKNRIELDRRKWLGLPLSLRRQVIREAISKISSLDDVTTVQLREVYNLIEKGVGKKHKSLPHSLRIELISGKIILVKSADNLK